LTFIELKESLEEMEIDEYEKSQIINFLRRETNMEEMM
jgi:hypothetical protein